MAGVLYKSSHDTLKLMSKIRQLYFYVVTLIGLLMVVFPTADLINQGLKTWVFPAAEETEFGPYPRPIAGPDGSVVETEEQAGARIKQEEGFARRQRASQKQRNVIRDISFLLVGIPLFLFHFRVVQREKGRE